MEGKKQKLVYLFLVLAIVALAFFVRSYQIEKIPAGVYPDEAVNGIDALTAIDTGHYQWFYTNNFGREGLFMNLISLSIRVFGHTALGLKAWSILFGTLTVLGMYFLGKELFKSSRAGLIAAYLQAFSFWAINFSRISFRAIMLPFILVFTFYFVLRGLRTKSYWSFALAGLFFGIGFHTYIAYRVSPLILVILLVFLIISKQNFIREYWKQLVLFTFVTLAVAFPLLFDFYKHPEYFETRANAISVLSPEVNHGNLIGTFLKSLGLSLVKYNFWGDQNWRHNYPPYPVLDPVSGILFLIGIIYAFIKFFHLLGLRFWKKIRDDKLVVLTLLLSWFFVMLIPEFLTAEGLPHALRSIGTMPVVFLFAVIPGTRIIGKAENFGFFYKIGALTMITLAFLFIGIFNPVKYFRYWGENRNQHAMFNENFKNMSTYLLGLPPETNKFVYVNGGGREMNDGLPVSAEVIRYLAWGNVENLKYIKDESEIDAKGIIVLMRYDQGFIDKIKKRYPEAQTQNIDLNKGHWSDFTIINFN
ncbi:MAG: glycosyltransferase family 39 protein [Candidatus Moranbacteria bacterium]|nr:glycosyltransferase family 39 protein [Candidatus Moranbacteria bacterium]